MRYKFDADYFARCVRLYADGRNLREVAHEAGITHSVLWRLSKGSTPSMDTFAQLCGVMRVNPTQFFYDDN